MGGKVGNLFRCLVRRKQVDSVHGGSSATGQPQLARALSVPHITAIGMSAILSHTVCCMFTLLNFLLGLNLLEVSMAFRLFCLLPFYYGPIICVRIVVVDLTV